MLQMACSSCSRQSSFFSFWHLLDQLSNPMCWIGIYMQIMSKYINKLIFQLSFFCYSFIHLNISQKLPFIKSKNTFIKSDTDGTKLNVIKANFHQPTDSIIFNGQKLRSFLLKSGEKKSQACSFSPLLLIMVLQVLAIALKKTKYKTSKLKRKDKTVTICR